MAQRKGLIIALVGFAIAMLGAIAGFAGFQIEEQWLSISGFAITVMGVAIGFIGIVYGWITGGEHAITGSGEAARELRNKIGRLWK